MKSFKVKLVVFTLAGKQDKEIEVKAASAKSAEKKAAQVMGNRDYDIIAVVAQ